MKKDFETPEVEVIRLKPSDIVTASVSCTGANVLTEMDDNG